MSKPATYPGIPQTLLAHLLDRAGSAGEISPRHLWRAVAPNSRQAQELYDAEITAAPASDAALSPKFTRIAQTLLNPKTNLSFRAWGDSYSAIETNMQFPGLIREGDGVALNQVNDLYRIGAFYDEQDVLEQIGSLIPLPPADAVMPAVFEAHLPIAIAVTLLAVLDLYRGLEFPDAPYSSADINGYIQGQWGLTGFDKLLSFIPALGQSTEPPSQVAVESALETLSTLAFLEEVNEGVYELSIELLPLASMTRGDLPGLQWQRIQNSDDGSLLTVNRIWLYGSDGLILMLAPMTRGSVLISSVSPVDMQEFFIEEFIDSVSNSAGAFDTAQKIELRNSENTCLECGAHSLTSTEFCVGCGIRFPLDDESSIKENSTLGVGKKPFSETISADSTAESVCFLCGTTLDPGGKFCTSCGSKTSSAPENTDKNVSPLCPDCGAEITEDLIFCTECGTRLTPLE